MQPNQTYESSGYHGPELTVTTQTLMKNPDEARRLRLILATKDQIIAALRRRIEVQDEWTRELMRLL